MANGWLHRADPGETSCPGRPLESLRKRRDLDRVADRGARSVGFNVLDGFGVDAGHILGFDDDRSVAVNAGCEIADLPGAVVVDCGCLDDRVHVVAIRDGVCEPPKHDCARAARQHRSRGLGVERPADTIAREDLAVPIEVAGTVGDFDRHPSRERHVALPTEERLYGEMDGHEGSRAGGLHVDTWPAQVQPVADACGEEVLVVAGVADHEHAERIGQFRIAEQVVDEIAVHPRTGVYADTARELRRRVPRVFQGLPAAFEEVTVLGVHQRGVSRADLEERCIERVDILEHASNRDVIWMGDEVGRDSRSQQFLGRPPGEGGVASLDQTPEVIQVASTWEPPRHADDRDVLITAETCELVGHFLESLCVSQPASERRAPRARATHAIVPLGS